MKYSEFYERVKSNLIEYKKARLPDIRQNGMWNGQEYAHILPRCQMDRNLFGVPFDFMKKNKIKVHRCFPHLNSSQAMCINFFYPLLQDLCLLGDVLSKSLPDVVGNLSVVSAELEYVDTNEKEGTNFDIYVLLGNGARLYFEVKYTEPSFGSAKDDSLHLGRYDKVYKPLGAKSLYFKDKMPDEKTFLRNYQLFRNLMYLQDEKDYFILLYPERRDDLLQKLTCVQHQYRCHNAVSLPWERLYSSTYEIIKGDRALNAHYTEFREKYLKDISCSI